MKKILVCLLFYIPCSGQLKFTATGCEPIIIEFDTMMAATIYQKAYNWSQYFYRDPKSGIKGTIPNEMIRIDAIHKPSVKGNGSFNSVEYNMTYNLTLEFKDGKMKATYKPIDVYNTRNVNNESIPYYNLFKPDGSIRKSGQGVVPESENTANAMIKNLVEFIKQGKKDW